MTDKELIKREIKRQKSSYQRTFDVLHKDDLDATIAYSQKELLDRLLQFIDSLPEEPVSEDLEEACDNYYDETWDEHGGIAMVVNNCHDIWYPSQATSDFFKAGAEWQKNKDLEDSLKSDMTMPNKFYEKGRFDMREEMMKMAEDTAGLSLSWGKDSKTKIIIIEEEQQ